MYMPRIFLNLTTRYKDTTIETWVADQFINKFRDAEAAKTSGQRLSFLPAEMCNGRTALRIKSRFSRMFHC